MKKRIEIDTISQLVTADAGVRLNDLERWLAKRGYTLGYRPPGTGGSPLRHYLDRRTSNRLAPLYGEIDDLCLALEAEGPGGPIRTKRVPRAATGPDFKKIFIGSQGRYARIRSATFRISRRPEQKELWGISWRRAGQQGLFLRRLAASGIRWTGLSLRGVRSLVLSTEGKGEIVADRGRVLQRLARETKGRIRRA